jgi:prophage maintenance system killer protein
LASKAAALLYALSKSQACPEGNKRVALILLEAFPNLDGRLWTSRAESSIADVISRVAESETTEREPEVGASDRLVSNSDCPVGS